MTARKRRTSAICLLSALLVTPALLLSGGTAVARESVPSSATEPASEPTTEDATEPAAEPEAEPTTEPAAEPEADPATEPEAEPATEPAAEQPVRTQQQAPARQFRLNASAAPFRALPGAGPEVAPGGKIGLGFNVRNQGEVQDETVLTVQLPPEQTFVSASGLGWSCSDDDTRDDRLREPRNVDVEDNRIQCRITLEPETTGSLGIDTQLSSSFRGTETAVTASIPEDLNSNPEFTTSRLSVPVEQSAAAAPTPTPRPSATSAVGSNAQALPVTGPYTGSIALAASGLLLTGVAAQVLGRRRKPAFTT